MGSAVRDHLRSATQRVLTWVKPLRPSVALITLKPSGMLLYIVGLACKNGVSSAKDYLLAALDDIKRADGCVGKTAGENTAGHAFHVVGSVVNVRHCSFSTVFNSLY